MTFYCVVIIIIVFVIIIFCVIAENSGRCPNPK